MGIGIRTTAVALRMPGEQRQMLQQMRKNLRPKRCACSEP
jgi:hypothetical protein